MRAPSLASHFCTFPLKTISPGYKSPIDLESVATRFGSCPLMAQGEWTLMRFQMQSRRIDERVMFRCSSAQMLIQPMPA